MSNAVLKLENIAKSYPQGNTTLHILQNISLQLNAGERVALVGPSGAGKSTLLQIAGLLDTPDSGTIRIAEEELSNASDHARTMIRRHHLGFVYQFHHLLPDFSALENVMLPQTIAGKPKAEATARALELLDVLGLQDRLAHRPSELSGGEQQRVAIARALANRPKVILADEPTGNLDSHTASTITAMLCECAKKEGTAMLIATHNLDLAKSMDRTLTLKDGKL